MFFTLRCSLPKCCSLCVNYNKFVKNKIEKNRFSTCRCTLTIHMYVEHFVYMYPNPHLIFIIFLLHISNPTNASCIHIYICTPFVLLLFSRFCLAINVLCGLWKVIFMILYPNVLVAMVLQLFYIRWYVNAMTK